MAGFGISLADTLFAEWDGDDAFLRLQVENDAAQRGPDGCLTRTVWRGGPAGRSCFLAWAELTGAAMLAKVKAVADGVWAGVEG